MTIVGEAPATVGSSESFDRVAVREAVPDANAGTPATALRRVVVLLDAMAATVAWTAAMLLPVAITDAGRPPLLLALSAIGGGVGVTLGLMLWQRLHLARVCGVPLEETRRLIRVGAVSAAALFVLFREIGLPNPGVHAASGSAAAFALLLAARGGFRSWIKRHRRFGRFRRPVVLVGANEDAAALYQILTDHPEMGFAVVGLVSSTPPDERLPVPRLGDVAEAVSAALRVSATGAIVAASALEPTALNRIVRELSEAGLHVHVSSGLRGIAHRRLRNLPLAHEPLVYLEPPGLSDWQDALKRCLDYVAAASLLLLSLPVLSVAALAIRLQDGGPVLFRQVRVGRDGRPFVLYKLRTMDPDADRRLLEVVEGNRRQGPLFKAVSDPRVTPVGRFLRMSGLDEMPQLWNILNGTMSLVGPRPALPDEVEQFDDELRTRTRVLPGITGLWQVEARDNPAFGPYRRLDLYYVENWSIGLDLSILLATVGVVVGRTFQGLGSSDHRQSPGGHPAVLE